MGVMPRMSRTRTFLALFSSPMRAQRTARSRAEVKVVADRFECQCAVQWTSFLIPGVGHGTGPLGSPEWDQPFPFRLSLYILRDRPGLCAVQNSEFPLARGSNPRYSRLPRSDRMAHLAGQSHLVCKEQEAMRKLIFGAAAICWSLARSVSTSPGRPAGRRRCFRIWRRSRRRLRSHHSTGRPGTAYAADGGQRKCDRSRRANRCRRAGA